jgi:hypothetical protein
MQIRQIIEMKFNVLMGAYNDMGVFNTSNTVINGFLTQLYPEAKRINIWPKLVSSVIKHQSILKFTHLIIDVGLLQYTLKMKEKTQI